MNNEEDTEAAIEAEIDNEKPKRARKKKMGNPKRGLGPVVTRRRRGAEDAIEKSREKHEESQRNAARQELERLNKRYNERHKESERWAASLIKSVISAQTMILRFWGYRQSVETQVKPSGRVRAWTDFKKIKVEWPLDRVPSSLDSTAVLDTVCQVKGIMQHEMGHLRFTTSWRTILDNSTEPPDPRNGVHDE